jgi:hypothetical protein
MSKKPRAHLPCWQAVGANESHTSFNEHTIEGRLRRKAVFPTLRGIYFHCSSTPTVSVIIAGHLLVLERLNFQVQRRQTLRESRTKLNSLRFSPHIHTAGQSASSARFFSDQKTNK